MASNGRPTKLTPAVHDAIVGMTREGNYAEVSAQAAGISGPTFWRWMKRGEEEPGSIYERFREDILKARAEAENEAIKIIKGAALDGTWQAAAWYLERSKPERWRLRQTTEMTGKDGGPIEQKITGDEARREVSALIDELAERRARKAAGG